MMGNHPSTVVFPGGPPTLYTPGCVFACLGQMIGTTVTGFILGVFLLGILVWRSDD